MCHSVVATKLLHRSWFIILLDRLMSKSSQHRHNKVLKNFSIRIIFFSKIAWTINLKDQHSTSVLKTLMWILAEKKVSIRIWSNKSKEFYCNHFESFLQKQIKSFSQFLVNPMLILIFGLIKSLEVYWTYFFRSGKGQDKSPLYCGCKVLQWKA